MGNKILTNHGKTFIKNVTDYFTRTNGDNSLLSGKNGILPYSDETTNKIWTANVINIKTNSPITNNSQLGDYLIYLFDLYAKQYDIDANVIAAQAFEESEYRIWVYPNTGSTASSISQIVMRTMYEIIYNKVWLTDEEKNKIISNLTNPDIKSSWKGVEKDKKINITNCS